jgi:ABC-2 type transport system ATP-binding protein
MMPDPSAPPASTALQPPQDLAPGLRIEGLTKLFGGRRAVDSLSLNLAPGTFYALLGANGAGKTTTMRMVAGLLAPDAGTISVFGHHLAQDPLAAKAVVAWMPDEPLIYDKLTPLEYLEFIAGLWSVEGAVAAARAEDLLKWLDLWAVRDARCETFSRGMRQKTALAGALLHEPRLLLLDEPFSGLDASVARQVKDLLVEKTRAGATVVLTTHVLEIAERLAERIGILHQGQLRAQGTLDELRAAQDRPGATLEEVFLALVDGADTATGPVSAAKATAGAALG